MNDIIERLKEEIERGESSLDTAVRVFGAMKTNGHEELAKRFNDSYTEYANDEVEIPQELLEEVYAKLASFPEPEKKKGLLDD